MRISHRLYLTVAPALLAVCLMAGLLYWGRYERRAPAVVLVVGGIAVLISLALTWANARIVARRIGDLADTLPGADAREAPDELEHIARGVTRLTSTTEAALASSAAGERSLQQRTEEYAAILARIADDTARRLAEIRLPLHILLEHRFGELNENQEEMLGAARAAAESADAELVSLKQIADLDLGAQLLRRDRLKPSDIFDALRPMLVASAEASGATVELSVAPLLPAIVGDRARLQDALATILGNALRGSPAGTRARLTVEQQEMMLAISLRGAPDAPSSVRATAAARLLEAHGGRLEHHDDELTILLPLESRGRVSGRA